MRLVVRRIYFLNYFLGRACSRTASCGARWSGRAWWACQRASSTDETSCRWRAYTIRIRVDIHLTGPSIQASKISIFKGVLALKSCCFHIFLYVDIDLNSYGSGGRPGGRGAGGRAGAGGGLSALGRSGRCEPASDYKQHSQGTGTAAPLRRQGVRRAAVPVRQRAARAAQRRVGAEAPGAVRRRG